MTGPRSGGSRPGFAIRPVALLGGMLLAAACVTPVGVDPIPPQDFQRQVTANVLSAGVPSGVSDQVLQRLNLRERFKADPKAALAEIHATLYTTEGGDNRLFALAELSYLHAEQSGERSYYLAAVAYAYAFLFPGAGAPTPEPLDPRTRLAAELYNRALTEGLTPGDGADVVITPGERRLPFGLLDFDLPGGEPVWGGHVLRDLRPAAHVKVRGLRNRYRRAGIGAPLLASLTPVKGAAGEHVRLPPSLRVPVTVFLRLDHVREGLATGQLRGTLEVYSMDAASQIEVEDRQVPLEFEPTAAIAYTLDRAPVWDSEIRAFLSGTFLQGRTGVLYTLTPYRRGRVPVVFVHGTASSPARWADLVNELEADPRIAPRVQLWFFGYNTGLPILYSAGLFREVLTKAVAEVDPEGTDPAMRRMVLIGHSQGGLLAKLAVVDSGDRFWDNVSETPFEALRVSDETRTTLRRSLFMTPLPFVSRVVFVATPHRGSDVAGFLVDRLRWLVTWALTLPPSLVRITGEVLVGSEDPLLRQQLRQGLPRSVDNMSPGNQGIKTLATLAVEPPVTAHSIIAVKGGHSLSEGGDGFVSYRSAHIDEAVSELIVQSDHSVQSHPEAIEEIRRILLEHLGSAGVAGGR